MKLKLIPRILNPDVFLRIYKSTVMKFIHEYEETKAMVEIHKMFTDGDIETALACIYVDGDYIVTNSSNRLLRLLEFGGPNVKALNILSKASKALDGRFL